MGADSHRIDSDVSSTLLLEGQVERRHDDAAEPRQELRDFLEALETVVETKPGWKLVRVWEPLSTDIPIIDKSERFDH